MTALFPFTAAKEAATIIMDRIDRRRDIDVIGKIDWFPSLRGRMTDQAELDAIAILRSEGIGARLAPCRAKYMIYWGPTDIVAGEEWRWKDGMPSAQSYAWPTIFTGDMARALPIDQYSFGPGANPLVKLPDNLFGTLRETATID